MGNYIELESLFDSVRFGFYDSESLEDVTLDLADRVFLQIGYEQFCSQISDYDKQKLIDFGITHVEIFVYTTWHPKTQIFTAEYSSFPPNWVTYSKKLLLPIGELASDAQITEIGELTKAAQRDRDRQKETARNAQQAAVAAERESILQPLIGAVVTGYNDSGIVLQKSDGTQVLITVGGGMVDYDQCETFLVVNHSAVPNAILDDVEEEN